MLLFESLPTHLDPGLCEIPPGRRRGGMPGWGPAVRRGLNRLSRRAAEG